MDFLGGMMNNVEGWRLSPLDVLLGILGSFLFSQIIAWTYCKTYRGFSYSRAFVHSLILGALCTTIMIGAIGNNLARGLGVLGALAIIRFRTQIRDPRDIIFLFACLAIGIACGAGSFHVAAIGTVGFCLAVGYLHISPFASLRTYEGLVRFLTRPDDPSADDILNVLEECCAKFILASQREAVQGEAIEYTFQVRLRDASYQSSLPGKLNVLPEVWDASILMHRATVEI